MHIKNLSPKSDPTDSQAAVAVLREARRLHRIAVSDALSKSLPVLRRVLSSNTLHGVSLPELFRTRSTVQRKHILRTLAIEAGFPNWEAYRWALRTMSVDQLEHFDMIQRGIGYPNFWFSTLAQAQEHAHKHGGRTLRVGQQAVVVPQGLVCCPGQPPLHQT
jgi:hypothetical protein